MQPKRPIVAALFFAITSTFFGCSSAPPSAPVSAPIVLRVSCPPGLAANVVRTYCQAWMARNDALVEIVAYGAEGPEDSGADAWVIAPAELGRWAAAARLMPVPEALQQIDDPFGWKGLLPLYREHLLLWDRTPYALPLVGEAPLFCYRGDQFKEAGLAPPSTWKDVDEGAAHCRAKSRLTNLPPLPADDDGLEREFYTIAAGYVHRSVSNVKAVPFDEAFSFHYDLKTGKPRIGGPGFVHALKLMQRQQRYRVDPAESPVAAFRRGACLFCVTDASSIYRLQEENSSVRDKFAIMRMPAAEAFFTHDAKLGDRPQPGNNWMPYLGAGGWLGVVPKSAVHSAEAFSLLAELGGREVSRQVVLMPRTEPARGGGAFRYEHFDRNARWEAFDLDVARTEELKLTVQRTLEHPDIANPVYRMRTPNEQQRRDLLLVALRKALNDPVLDPAEALADVAAKWQEMDRLNPNYQKELQLGLGLSPR